MRAAVIGGGEIARLIVEAGARGELGAVEAAVVAGRAGSERARALAARHGLAYACGVDALIAAGVDVAVEAASHEAVREYAPALLECGVSVIVLSAGVLCDDALRARLERAACASEASLYVPSGGIGGLDALKAACIAGVDAVEIAVTKPPRAWKNIPYVEALGVDLDALDAPITLFEGSAREGVPHFPANVNIAAALSMAGIGYDRTRLKVVADPALTLNTHFITIRGRSGTIGLKFESVPFTDNPKTAMLAAYSAIAALKQFASRVRYGT